MTIQSIVQEVLQSRCFTAKHEGLIYKLLHDRCFDEADLRALAHLNEALIQGLVQY